MTYLTQCYSRNLVYTVKFNLDAYSLSCLSGNRIASDHGRSVVRGETLWLYLSQWILTRISFISLLRYPNRFREPTFTSELKVSYA